MREGMSRNLCLTAAMVAALTPASSTLDAQAQADPLSTRSVFMTGVNLASAGFGPWSGPHGPRGRHGVQYVYPSDAYVSDYKSPTYFLSKGMNTFRLSFRWERIQPKLMQRLDPDELERLVRTTNSLTQLGAWVILDLHNYARYGGVPIGAKGVEIELFADAWWRLATVFRQNRRVLFGIMNEPHDMSTEVWVDAANAAIQAIRKAQAENVILVPGNGFSNSHLWYYDTYGTPNAAALQNIRDPLDRVVFEAHLYLDSNASGQSDTCVSETVGVERLEPFANWLRERRKVGFIGEFGTGTGRVCLAALSAMAKYMLDNRDLFLGWTYWAAGPWWPREYFMLIEPGETDAPQMMALMPHLQPARKATASP